MTQMTTKLQSFISANHLRLYRVAGRPQTLSVRTSRCARRSDADNRKIPEPRVRPGYRVRRQGDRRLSGRGRNVL